MSKNINQIAIVGSGPTGATLALLLVRQGIKVKLIEASSNFERLFRGEGLMPSGLDALKEMGLFKLLKDIPHQSIDSWDFLLSGKSLFCVDEPIETNGIPCTTVSQPHLLRKVIQEAQNYPEFEFIQGKPLIGSTPGTRNVLAMLLMTFGLESTIKLLPPSAWLQGLRQQLDHNHHQDAKRKSEWWTTAQQAAASLRQNFSVGKLGVIGDLVMPHPLNYWSDITLVYWEKFEDSWRVYDVLREIDPDMRVDLLLVDEYWLTADQRWQIEHCLVEV